MTIVSAAFDDTALATARALGLPGLQYVVVPWVYRTLDQERVVKQTDDVMDELVRELTTAREGKSDARKPASAENESFEGWDRLEAADHMNEEFLERDWGDGYPLVAPTPEAVERLLKATHLPADHVVCYLPPGYGVATVEKVAINAVMAGAGPEHMPVIIAALKALAKMDREKVHSFIASTSANASLLVVNGPIAKELGINARSALGPGRANRVNILIGRAYTLCLKNIGHWYPGEMSNASIGSMRRFTGCVAENEEASPWEPFHVEHGFNRDDSVVTVLGAKAELDVGEHGNTTAEGMLKTIAYNCSFSEWDRATRSPESDFETIIFFPPDVARALGEGHFSKRAAKQFIHHHARNFIGRMGQAYPLKAERIAPEWRWLMDLSDKELGELWEPVRTGPDRYHLICVGADRAKSLVMSSHYSPPSSEKIDVIVPNK